MRGKNVRKTLNERISWATMPFKQYQKHVWMWNWDSTHFNLKYLKEPNLAVSSVLVFYFKICDA